MRVREGHNIIVRETEVLTQKLDIGVFQEATVPVNSYTEVKKKKRMTNAIRFVIRNLMNLFLGRCGRLNNGLPKFQIVNDF